MDESSKRVERAFAHRTPDRTPLFEIFQPYHPIHWPICGRTIATDMAMAWDAMAEGVTPAELLEADAQAQYRTRKFFELDMVRLNACPVPIRPVKTALNQWTLNGIAYVLNERTRLIEPLNPGQEAADSQRSSEADFRCQVEAWDGRSQPMPTAADPLFQRVKELAEADGIHWLYMGEIGAGTGVAFYPPFLLMLMLEEPELYRRWLDMQKATSFPRTVQLIRRGCRVIAMGGDVSCDKGPFLSPACYREFILPVIQEHVRLIHDEGALAVYTSDGNHWPIQDDFFCNSGIDGYKEVDQAAGMTWPRLIAAGIDRQVCIIGNVDARHTLCHAAPAAVEREVVECLDYGRRSPGGHILHASHSVHEDVKAENYLAVIAAYRRYFGLAPLSL